MSGINNNNYSDELIKRLQMKGLMEGKKEEPETQPEEQEEEQNAPKPTCSENNEGSLQALDYMAMMNLTFMQNSKKAAEEGFTLLPNNSDGKSVTINDEEVLVITTGEFYIAVDGNNIVIKAGKNASSIEFVNSGDLNITVEKSAVTPAKEFNLKTGSGNDTIVVADGAKVKKIETGAGDDTVVNFGQASGIATGVGNDAVLNKGKITNSIDTGSGADVIQNDGTTNNIYAGVGNDQIVNNGTVKSTLLGQADVDTIIDGRTIKFEKKSFELADNETAVINKDGSVTASSENGSKIFTPKGALDNIEIKTGSESITLNNTSPTVKLFNSNKISLENLNNVIELAAIGDKEGIALLDLPEAVANEIMELIPEKAGITRSGGEETTTINGEPAVKNADGTFSVKTDDLIIKNYDENQVLTSVTIGTGANQRTINADSQLLIDFNNGTINLKTLNNSLVIEAYFPNSTEQEKSWLNILQKINPEGIDVRKIGNIKATQYNLKFSYPGFEKDFLLGNNHVIEERTYLLLNNDLSLPQYNYSKDTFRLISEEILNTSYTKYNDDGTKSVALYDSSPVIHQTSFTIYDANNIIIFQEINQEYLDYMNKLNSIDKSLTGLVFNIHGNTCNDYHTNWSHISLTDQVKSDIDILVKAHEKGLEASGGVKGNDVYKEAFDNYVSSQVVKQIGDEINVGDVVETQEGLFVNDGISLKKLNMTKEQYLELFPPVARYSSDQGGTGDCYFVSSVLNASMNNPRCYAELLQMFNVDSETGDITITYKGLPDYPVIFPNGELFVMDKEGSGEYTWKNQSSSGIFSSKGDKVVSKGCQMIEQAFAIARFASEKDEKIDEIDIDDAMSYIWSGSGEIALSSVFGKHTLEFNSFSKIKNISFLHNFNQNQIENLDSISEKVITYLENKDIFANLVTELESYFEENNIQDVSINNMLQNLYFWVKKNNKFLSSCINNENVDTEKFKTLCNNYGASNPENTKFWNKLSDEQITYIVKFYEDNNVYDVFNKGNYSYGSLGIELSNKFKVLDLSGDIIKLSSITSNDIENIRENGLYSVLINKLQKYTLDNLSEQLNNGEILICLGNNGNKEIDHGHLHSHEYSISNIDTKNKTISVNNPWNGGYNEILLSYEEFFNLGSSLRIQIFNISLLDEQQTTTINGEPAVKNDDGTFTVTLQTDNGTITKNYSEDEKLKNFSFESTDGNYKFTLNNSSDEMTNVDFSIDSDGNLHIKNKGTNSHKAALILENMPKGKKLIIEEGSNISALSCASDNAMLNLVNNGSIVIIYGTNNNDIVENHGHIFNLLTKSGNDNITNDGNIDCISSGEGNDTVINNGTANRISTGEGNDIVITHDADGNYTVNGENAIKNNDGTFTITTDNVTKIFTAGGTLSNIEIQLASGNITLDNDSQIVKALNDGIISLATVNTIIDNIIATENEESINIHDDGTFSVQIDDLIIKNYDENQVLTSVTIGTGTSQRTIDADSQLLIDFNNGTIDLETLNNSLVIEAYFPDSTAEEKSWLNILQKINPYGVDIKDIRKGFDNTNKRFMFFCPQFKSGLFISNSSILGKECYKIENGNLSPIESMYYTKDTFKLIGEAISNKSYTKYNDDGTKSVALYEKSPAFHQTSFTIYDADNNIISQSTNQEYINYMNKLNEIDTTLFKQVFGNNDTSSFERDRFANWSYVSPTDQVKSDIEILIQAHAKGLEASGGVKDNDIYKEAFDNYVSSQMVKDYTNTQFSLMGIAAKTQTGDVIETKDGLYVNNGTTLKKLNMTKEQYLELFPPVARYSSDQGGTGDCYFIATILNASMNNPRCYAELLQMFNVDSENNTTVTFKGLSDYPVTFKNSELFVMNRKGSDEYEYNPGGNYPGTGVSGCIGCQMIEQAFAIAKFSSEKYVEINKIDIDDAMSYIEGGSFWHFKDIFKAPVKIIRENIKTEGILLNFSEEQIDNFNSFSEEFATYLEYQHKYNNPIKEIAEYLDYSSIEKEKMDGIKVAFIGYWQSYKQNGNFENFKNKFNNHFKIAGLAELNDEQITFIIKCFNDNKFESAYSDYRRFANIIDKKLEPFVSAQSELSSRFIRESCSIDNIEEIKEKGLYDFLLNYYSMDNVAEQLNNGEIVIGLGSNFNNVTNYTNGHMVRGHMYSISNIDTVNKTVSISNPWDGARNDILLSYDEFYNAFEGNYKLELFVFNTPLLDEQQTITINSETAIKNDDGTYTVTFQDGDYSKIYNSDLSLKSICYNYDIRRTITGGTISEIIDNNGDITGYKQVLSSGQTVLYDKDCYITELELVNGKKVFFPKNTINYGTLKNDWDSKDYSPFGMAGWNEFLINDTCVQMFNNRNSIKGIYYTDTSVRAYTHLPSYTDEEGNIHLLQEEKEVAGKKYIINYSISPNKENEYVRNNSALWGYTDVSSIAREDGTIILEKPENGSISINPDGTITTTDKDGVVKKYTSEGVVISPDEPISDPRNNTICKLMGWETDRGITNAKYAGDNILSFERDGITYTTTYKDGKISSILGKQNGYKASTDSFSYYDDGNLAGKTTIQYEAVWNTKPLSETSIKYNADGTPTLEFSKSYVDPAGVRKDNVVSYIYKSANYEVTNYCKMKYPCVWNYKQDKCPIRVSDKKTILFSHGEKVLIKQDGTIVAKLGEHFTKNFNPMGELQSIIIGTGDNAIKVTPNSNLAKALENGMPDVETLRDAIKADFEADNIKADNYHMILELLSII